MSSRNTNNNSTNNTNKKWIRTRSNEPKSIDELNYEELREFAQEGSNRYCFDCHQRGPTYVNMTIGSFVCMRCSGLLRGLTPPHRVKSMSMATFTTEEMEYLRERGNDYCKQVWLQLFEGNVLTESNDEQDIKDFMIQKYERKRYYVDPKLVTNLQINNKSNNINNNNSKLNNNNEQLKSNMENKNSTDEFIADFSKADIFIAEPLNKSTNTNGFVQKHQQQQQQQQASFANFDNNPIFINNTTNNGSNINNNATINRPQIQSKLTHQLANSKQLQPTMPPSEDRYAALKDLDIALKNQQQQQQHIVDWIGNVNNSIGIGSPAMSSSISSYGGSPAAGAANHFNTNTNNGNGNAVNGNGNVWNPFNTSTATMLTPPSTATLFLTNNKSASPEQYINPFRSTTSQLQLQQNNHDLSLFNTTINPFKQQQLNNTMFMSNYNTTPSAAGAATASFSNNPFL